MKTQSTTVYSRLYRDFQEIDATAYRRIVRFYESREDRVEQLEFEECFDLQVSYCKALFEIGAYQRHLRVADRILETSILQGVQRWNGRDIFLDTLFDKAASHHNRLEFREAEHVLRELLKLQPDNREVIDFLRRNGRRQRSAFVQHSRAVSMALFLAAAVVICVEMLFVRTLYGMYEPLVQAVRNTIFGTGLLVLVGSDLIQRIRVHRRVHGWATEAQDRRRARTEAEIRQ